MNIPYFIFNIFEIEYLCSESRVANMSDTIKLFIRDDGIKIATLEPNVLKAYFGKLENLNCLKQNEVDGPSIYILLNNSEDEEKQKIYIGQSTNANQRFQTHKQKKLWIDNFIIFNGLTLKESYLNYIEDCIVQKAKQNLVDIDIDTKTTNKNFLDESDKNDAQKVCDSIIFILKHLNVLNLVNPEKKSKSPVFYITLQKPHNDKKAMLKKVDEGYVLLKDSYIQPEIRKSFKTHNYNNLRNKLIEEKKIIQSGNCLVVTENVPFSYCSPPAAIVTGRASNGSVEWKLEDGTTLANFEERLFYDK